MNITIIGGGNMGLNYAQSFLHSQVVSSRQLTIVESNPERLSYLKELNLCQVIADVNEGISNEGIIVLAIKPQFTPALFNDLASHITEQHVILSIMAGITIATMQKDLKCTRVVRAMPNLPSQIGFGMTVFTSSDDVTKQDLFKIHNLLNTTGKSIYVDDEVMVDAATAISGSGPAYAFYLMNSMIDSALKMGFNKSEAELLVEQTILGTIHLYKRKEHNCEEWIDMVASKGGTTEAALNNFDSHKLQEHLKAGFDAAFKRAKELGN